MWLQNKACLYLSLLLLASCGFQPMYGRHQESEADSALRAGIKVDHVTSSSAGVSHSRVAQLFKANLEDQLNPGGASGNAAYRLAVTLTSRASPIGVDPAGTVSRYNVFMNSNYVLYRNSDGVRMTSGTLTHVSSYNNITGAYFSTYISEQDALKRGIEELAQLYRQRMASFIVSAWRRIWRKITAIRRLKTRPAQPPPLAIVVRRPIPNRSTCCSGRFKPSRTVAFSARCSINI
jgi:hypothetical protein